MPLATYERVGHVAVITYNRPGALNAIKAEMRRDLNAARAMKEVAVKTADMTMVKAIRFGETMRRVVTASADASEGGCRPGRRTASGMAGR